MARVRIVLVLVALGLLVPGVLLVRRALESVQIEQAARHRAVAERIFDEMERSLSTFLVAEEARPIGHYRHIWSPSGSPGVLLRSPLADPPDGTYVMGHFEVDASGQVHTPLRPRQSEAPAGWPLPSDSALAAAERVLRLATEAWPASPVPPEPAQKPGTTVAVGKAAQRDQQLRMEEKGAPLADAYDALKSLNRGAQLRSKRSQKVLPPDFGSYSGAEPTSLPEEPAPSIDSLAEAADTEAPALVSNLAREVVTPKNEGLAKEGLEDGLAESDFDSREGRKGNQAAGAFADAMAAAAPRPPNSADPRVQAPEESVADFEAAGRLVEASLGQPVAAEVHSDRDVGRDRKIIASEESAPSRQRAPATSPPVEPEGVRVGSKKDEAKPKAGSSGGAGAAPSPFATAESEDSTSLPRVVVDPMLGFALDGEHIVLHRTVWRGAEAARQGLILEVAPLAESLKEVALPAGTFPGSLAKIGTGTLPNGPADPRTYSYRHRFAEPFDAVSVNLTLPLLAGASGARTIYILSLLLMLSGSVGLFALYRMVGVVVGFSERRSNFVAAVSHELKTPLTAIRMYAEMLRDGMVPTESKRAEYYGTITAESERLSRLIDNVLEFSKLERGTREMSWAVGDLGVLVEEAVGVLMPHAQAQGFTLRAEIEKGLPPVRFDRDAVLQILFNLVDNALKYAGEARSRELCVTCQRDGDKVVLLVRDHGPGVASEHMKRIFEPFYRGESELTRRAQGTGIGLSLVKGLAEQMGAALQAKNADEGGFEVGLVFPAPS